MRPGQLEPNEFELAILHSFALQEPDVARHIQQLHVLSREFTGVGCFTRFRYEGTEPEHQLTSDAQIRVPGPPNGPGALLFCRGDHPICLELFTYGDEYWDGVYEGYSIAPTRNRALQPTPSRRMKRLKDEWSEW